MRKVILYIVFSGGYMFTADSQTPVTPLSYPVQGQVYTQSFDGLPSSGTFSLTGKGPFNLEHAPFSIPALRGWQFMLAGGTGTAAAFLVSTGSSTANGVQSLGAAGSPERAIGSLSTASGVYALGLLLTNNTGIILNSFTLRFTAEQWRKGGSGNKNVWSFRYKTGLLTSIDTSELTDEPRLNFGSLVTTPGAGSLNGNLPENRQAISYTVTGVSWKPGEQILLRWDDADETGSDDACGIDELQFSAAQVEDKPSIVNITSVAIGEDSAVLKATINDNNAPTTVTAEYDTASTFRSAKNAYPQPDYIDPASGATVVSAIAMSLEPATTYYYRFTAINRNGSTSSPTATFHTMDKTPPLVHKISIPDKPMKTGDTVTVTILVKPEKDVLKVVGTVAGHLLQSPAKKNDSTYSAYFTVANGGIDIAPGEIIPVTITVTDASGNASIYNQPIIQDNDALDMNRPLVSRLQVQAKGVYKAGDTLLIVVRFSEKVFITPSGGSPHIKLTIGNNTRQAMYMAGSGTDSVRFGYVVISTDEDSTALKPATAITIGSGAIKDAAGNNSSASLPPYQGTALTIDGVAPRIASVAVPAAGFYKQGDTLPFVVHFTEKIRVNISTDTVTLKITIGNAMKNMRLAGVDTQQLRFIYVVQRNDLDKKGITLGTIYMSGEDGITDIAGNPASLTIRNAGPVGNIKVDAIAPVFSVTTTTTISACVTDSLVAIGETLVVSDEEKGDSIRWTIQPVRIGQSAVQLVMTAVSTGNRMSPAVYYTTSSIKSNPDTLLIRLSDGVNESEKFIVIYMQPAISANRVFSAPHICSGTSARIRGSNPNGGNGIYDYVWEYSTDSIGFGKVNTTSYEKDLENSPKLLATSWFRRKVLSGKCIDTSAAIKIIPMKTGLWTGNFSGDWQNINNWCGTAIPGPLTDVVVPGGTAYHPTITDTGSCHNLSIGESTIFSVKGSLQITGDLSAAPRSIDLLQGRLTAAGTLKQTIAGTAFLNNSLKDLSVSNPSGLFLSDSLFIDGNLQLVNGYLQTRNQLVIRHTGSIGASAAGSFIEGNVSVEHQVPGGKKAFHLIAHPLSSPIGLGMIKDSIDITGIGGIENGFTQTPTNNPSAFWYPTVSVKDTPKLDNNWTAFTHTNGEGINAWKRYQGIRLFTRGKPGQGLNGQPAGDGTQHTYLPGAVNLRFTGMVNTGDQEIILLRTDSSGFNLVGNPYPSPVDLSKISYGTGVSGHYWIWNPHQGDEGGYSAVPFQSNFVLPAFGAFFVKARDSLNHFLLFTEHCKVSPAGTTLLPVVSRFPDYHIELRLFRGETLMDRVLLYHSDSARTGMDKFDAEKLMNSGTNFYSLSRERNKLSIDARPITNESSVSLGLQPAKPGLYSLLVADCKLPDQSTLQLHDKYMGLWITPEKDSSYSFLVSEDTASFGDNRFELTSKPAPVGPALNHEKITMTIGPVPAISEVVVHYALKEDEPAIICIRDQTGNALISKQVEGNTNGRIVIPISRLVPGIYLIEMRSRKYLSTKKMIKL